MRYGIVINLGYENRPYELVKGLFDEIRSGMLDNGFRQDGRVFTVQMPALEACELARGVIDRIDENYGHNVQIYDYIDEFYGFEFSQAINLMVPDPAHYCVVEYGGNEGSDLPA